MSFETWFPTVVLFETIDCDLDSLRTYVDQQAEQHPEYNTTGHWSGFNSSTSVQLQKESLFQNLTLSIQKLVNEYIITQAWDTDSHKFILERMWANRYVGNQVTRKHFHSGILSGCFYLDEGHDLIIYNPMLNNRPEFAHTQIWTKSENYFNANKILYSSKPGKCIIWPSMLMHETEKNSKEVTRSIAFDVWVYSDKNPNFPIIKS